MDILESNRILHGEPNFIKDLSKYGQIHFIECSPYEDSQDVMLVAFETKILVIQLVFTDTLIVNVLSEFSHPSRCTALSIAPNSMIHVITNQQLTFCAAGKDFKLRVFNSNLNKDSNENTCVVLTGHKNYVNDVMFDSENTYLASGSDDNTVNIWYVDDLKLKSTFYCTSPVMNVLWHSADIGKLLVAEKIGIIKFYNVETCQPILSLDFGKSLSSVHWAPNDNQIVGSLQMGELLIWDLTKQCLPQCSNIVFPENGGHIRFSAYGELCAVVNSLEGTLKVLHSKTQYVKLTADVTLPTNVRWHYRYPLVIVADDRNLCFWKINTK